MSIEEIPWTLCPSREHYGGTRAGRCCLIVLMSCCLCEIKCIAIFTVSTPIVFGLGLPERTLVQDIPVI